MSKKSDEGAGCAVLITIVAISIGVGELSSAGVGWLAFGAMFFALVVLGS